MLAEENRFQVSTLTGKNGDASKEPSHREVQAIREKAQPWVEDVFQLDDPGVRDAAIESIREAIKSPDPAEVGRGLVAFTQLGSIRFDKASFHDIVLPKLESSEIFIRDYSVTALGMCGLQEGDLDRLIGMIDDPNKSVRKSVAGQIVWGVDRDLTGKAGDAILTLLEDEDHRFRTSIMSYMWGGKYSSKLESRILELSRQPEDSYNALYYALSTQANKSRASVERLIEYLPDLDTTNVGHRAAWGLGQGVAESEHGLVTEAALKLVEGREGGLFRGRHESTEKIRRTRRSGGDREPPRQARGRRRLQRTTDTDPRKFEGISNPANTNTQANHTIKNNLIS